MTSQRSSSAAQVTYNADIAVLKSYCRVPKQVEIASSSVRHGTVQQSSTATSSTASGSERLPSTADLPQRPRATSPPRVRIEGVRGSNPLSSTSRADFEHGTGP